MISMNTATIVINNAACTRSGTKDEHASKN